MIEPAFVAALKRARSAQAASRPGPALAALSPREAQVMHCVCQGMTDKEIARALAIALPSVRTYVQRLFGKLGVHRRAGIAHLANRLH